MKSSAVEVDLEEGTASLNVRNLKLFDYFDILNALFRNRHTPVKQRATVSFKVDWTGPVVHRASITNVEHQFKGTFLTNSAQMEWSAHREDGFKFVSDPIGTSSSVFSEIGHDQNGVFFAQDSGEDDSNND